LDKPEPPGLGAARTNAKGRPRARTVPGFRPVPGDGELDLEKRTTPQLGRHFFLTCGSGSARFNHTFMRKLIAMASVFGTICLCQGQGYVDFLNTSSSRISVGGTLAPNYLVATYYLELLVAPTSVTTIGFNLAGWTDTGDYATNNQESGRINPANNTPDGAGVPIPGYAAAATANFAIVGWSAAIATNFLGFMEWYDGGQLDGPLSGSGNPFDVYYGISTVATNIELAPDGGPYNNVFGPAGSGRIQGMSLDYLLIPEPSTFALTGLGAAALVTFRRQRRAQRLRPKTV
jgi:hypothetical protein